MENDTPNVAGDTTPPAPEETPAPAEAPAEATPEGESQAE